ncbi:MAG: 16S rRNA (cytidine(1402)-2'-O)-methyltransferase [Bacteroidales bacterium]|nr:16S rRNA (cytidine(1402)-2'-O)-methyltransferase [Bacteroidales bacterium]MDD2812268.1 16S rRNA (cytidine(1402)-2'-O)-methyltransferase [Bacteroidales bacterium]MDD3871211.1 16S rRNA (cytidine(1402)-2'-O)-methyltransferase [Bacteroidales bacterium]
MRRSKPDLYLVPTPVGNLEDITLRALRILKEVDFILAEDTRTSGILLNHYEIKKPLLSHHKFNEHHSVKGVIMRLQAGECAALITDSGTPGISDPGFLLIRSCLEAELVVECLPGPTAFVPALVESGLPTERFVFEGFLPVKKGRSGRIRELAGEDRTVVIYESPFRLVKTLEQLAVEFGPDRFCSVSRELTKIHAETVRGTLGEVAKHYRENSPKGELVIVVGRSGL